MKARCTVLPEAGRTPAATMTRNDMLSRMCDRLSQVRQGTRDAVYRTVCAWLGILGRVNLVKSEEEAREKCGVHTLDPIIE